MSDPQNTLRLTALDSLQRKEYGKAVQIFLTHALGVIISAASEFSFIEADIITPRACVIITGVSHI